LLYSIFKNKNRFFRSKLKDDKGAIAIIFALLLVVIIGMAAFVIDEGSLYQTRRSIQTVADAAAFAGVQELPENPEKAIQKAIEYAALNNLALTSSDITISRTYVNNDTITVSAVDPDAKLYFAGIFNKDSATVGANASAVIGSPSEITGVVPWAVLEDTYTPGVEYNLKYGSPDLGPGNFGAVSIDGRGASIYRNCIINGCTTPLSIGSWIETEPGNMTGPTKQGTQDRIYNQINNQFDTFNELTQQEGSVYKLINPDSQYIIVPMVSSFPNGRKDIQIVGFLQFVITYFQGSVVKGTYINYAILDNNSSIGAVNSTGLRVIRLLN
jgi:Flp pilus assembly protein TadG